MKLTATKHFEFGSTTNVGISGIVEKIAAKLGFNMGNARIEFNGMSDSTSELEISSAEIELIMTESHKDSDYVIANLQKATSAICDSTDIATKRIVKTVLEASDTAIDGFNKLQKKQRDYDRESSKAFKADLKAEKAEYEAEQKASTKASKEYK